MLSTGAIISRDDFDKLSWNATGNQGGSFSFQPLNAKQEPLTTVSAQTITVVEHPDPPRYPDPVSTKPQPVAHGADLTLGALTFNGLDKARAPAAIRITAIQAHPAGEATDASPPILVLLHADGSETVLNEGATVNAEDFGRLQWKTAGNEGGHFSFQPLAPDGQPLAGSSPQEVSVIKHPPPPIYETNPAPWEIERDQAGTLDASRLEGTDPARKPAGIRILSVEAHQATDENASALTLAGHTDPVSEGWVIVAEDFDKLNWSTAQNQGGLIRFIPVNDDGTPILGAPVQQIRIEELPGLPVYDNSNSILYPHAATPVIDAKLLAGIHPNTVPFSVKILRIDASTPHPLRMKNGDAVSLNQVISSDEFDQLSWHSTGLEGYFQFIPVQPDGNELPGAMVQTVYLNQSVEPPQYPDTPTRHAVEHDTLSTLPLKLFEGTDPYKQPANIVIDVIKPHHATSDAPALWFGSLDDAKPLDKSQAIHITEVHRIHWDSRHNEGGTIEIIPLDGASSLILNPDGSIVRHTIQLQELPPRQPVYPGTPPTLLVREDGLLHVTAHHLGGSDPSQVPFGIRIEAISLSNPTNDAAQPLMIDPDGTGQQAAQHVTIGQIIQHADFDKLYWDSSTNTGGSFRFVPVSGKGEALPDIEAQSIHVLETTRAPHYPTDNNGMKVRVVHDGSKRVPATMLTGDDPNLSPYAILIASLSPSVQQGNVPLVAIDRDGPEGPMAPEALKAGDIIERQDFDKLVVNVSNNHGGQWYFTPLDQHHQPILSHGQIPRHQIDVSESSRVPPYKLLNGSNNLVGTWQVEHNGTYTFPVHAFRPDYNNPWYVKITTINEIDDTDPAHSALRLEVGTNQYQELHPGDIINLVHYDRNKVQWDTSTNRGGSFSFLPLESYKTDAIEGIDPLTHQVVESSPLPAYNGPRTHYDVHDRVGQIQTGSMIDHNALHHFDRRVFAGDDDSKAPTSIQISYLKEEHDQDTTHSALTLRQGDSVRHLTVGSRVSIDQLNDLYWDSTTNDGGIIRFYPLDAMGKHVYFWKDANTGSLITEVNLRLTEAPASASRSTTSLSDQPLTLSALTQYNEPMPGINTKPAIPSGSTDTSMDANTAGMPTGTPYPPAMLTHWKGTDLPPLLDEPLP
ncbi:MAG: hypothetical protein Q4D91_09140 [Lautropia sp.]|nr:hypothetical protein [Lautropia sp.]